jgi:hypothetical protein
MSDQDAQLLRVDPNWLLTRDRQYFSYSPETGSAAAQGSRSTVLRPLAWLFAICAAAIVAAVEVKAPQWVVVVFVIALALTVILYLSAYVYCLFNDRDALRSETYSIHKLAIEKGYMGDSLTGILEGNRVIRAVDQRTAQELKE